MRTHYGPWQPCWISNQHQKQKSGRGPSNEHFWQAWFNSVPWFQRRRFKCEKLTDGQRTLTHDKSSHGLWPSELIMYLNVHCITMFCNANRQRLTLSVTWDRSVVSSTNKTDHHDITEILLKMVLNTITLTNLKQYEMPKSLFSVF